MNQDHIVDWIERYRSKLLDTTGRNPLISAPVKRNRLIRVVDELPSVMMDQLAAGKRMRLQPLPDMDDIPEDEKTPKFEAAFVAARHTDGTYLEAIQSLGADEADENKEYMIERALRDRVRAECGMPLRGILPHKSIEEHARAHGINPSYTLPEQGNGALPRHHDDLIQTLFLPNELRRKAARMYENARTREREIGINTLRAAFGLLEWSDSKSSQIMMSPLALIEIGIEEDVRSQSYWIRGKDEPVEPNRALLEKFKREYGIDFPAIDPGEGIEAYFARIQNCATPEIKWTVRRQVVIGDFPASTIALWLDLDTSRRDFISLPSIQAIFPGDREAASYSEDYETDDPLVACKVPITVLDTDSSQFSALADIADGRNLAIEGPPGTGKSQTIVNAIAAAMASGKRVLFVAQKAAALSVVKNRLTAIGLGEFLLHLDAKASRAEIYSSIKEAADARERRRKQPLNRDEGALEKAREELVRYLDILQEPYGATGEKVFDILAHAIRTTPELAEIDVSLKGVEPINLRSMTAERRVGICKAADKYGSSIVELGTVAALWKSGGATRIDAEDACSLAGQIALAVSALASDFGEEASASLKLFDQAGCRWRKTVATEMNSGTVIDADLLKIVARGDAEMFRSLLARKDEFDELESHLQTILNAKHPVDGRPIELADLDMAIAISKGGILDPAAEESRLAEIEARTGRLQAARAFADNLMRTLRLPGSVEVNSIVKLAMALEALPVHKRSQGLERGRIEAGRRIDAFLQAWTNAIIEIDRLGVGDVFWSTARNEDSIERLRETASVLRSAGFFERLGGKFKTSHALATSLFPAVKDRMSLADQCDSAARAIAVLRKLAQNNLVALPDRGANPFVAVPEILDAISEFLAAVDLLAECLPSALLDAAVRHPEKIRLRIAGVHRVLAHYIRLGDASQHVLRHEKLLIRARAARDEAARVAAVFKIVPPISSADIHEFRKAMVRRDDLAEQIKLACATSAKGDSANALDLDRSFLASVINLIEARPGAESLAAYRAVTEKGTIGSALEAAEQIERKLERLCDLANVSMEIAVGLELAQLRRALKTAAEDVYGLVRMNAIRRSREILDAEQLAPLAVACQNGTIVPKRFSAIVEAVIARAMSRDVWRTFPSLEGYDGRKLDELRKTIATHDKRMLQSGPKRLSAILHNEEWGPMGSRQGPKAQWTERALVENEMNKKKRWISVRDLTLRSGIALSALKPCWLMSPLAVAQYLSPDDCFDLVIVDEASQMMPQFALGALSRAKQVVIVGDTKQLPPTKFFLGGAEADEEDEELGTDNESILEIANAAFQPVRQLRWHYRSRDARLIAASNKWMYSDNLVVFPNADEGNPDLGLKHVKVDGLYNRGINRPEAESVIREVAKFMKQSINRSLAVVTMNSKQCELLQEEFAMLLNRDPDVASYVNRWREYDGGIEEFVIKNLENIQGDERDVIFISTVYGPITFGGKVPQRFGPVNQHSGARRLNVLFSRAKTQILTITSLSPADIITGEGKSKGVQMLRAWLEYSSTGILPGDEGSKRSPDSEFEERVITVIESLGYEAVPQVGAAGYFIDIGVRAPATGTRFVLGVECDGARYHSSRSSRERDRLRQEVLEGLGWCFHRIWSTDWFNDPAREAERLQQAIEVRLAGLRDEIETRGRNAEVIAAQRSRTQKINPELPHAKPDPDPTRQSEQTKEHLPAHVASQPMIVDTHRPNSMTVRTHVGCEVTVLDERGMESNFVLTERTAMPEIGYISSSSPLGRALLDRAVGEEFVFKAPSGERRMRIMTVNKCG